MKIIQSFQFNLGRHLLPQGPGPMVGRHVINSGHGRLLADNPGQPGLLLAQVGGNQSLSGRSELVSVAALHEEVQPGFLDAPEHFEDRLVAAFPDLKVWPRLIYAMQRRPDWAPDERIRRLHPNDLDKLRPMFAEESSWIWVTWESAESLLASGYAVGALRNEQVVSIACSFFVGDAFEDVGVVTSPAYRGQGLSTACVRALANDIFDRGRVPSWSTSNTNLASQRVAEKSGFKPVRRDRLYVINMEIPE